jgi:hypothetical protein
VLACIRAEKKDKEEAELDEFTRLKKLSARQVRQQTPLFFESMEKHGR